MPADLEAIVAAARRGELRLSDHYESERLGLPDRPSYTEILFGLEDGSPEVASDDEGRNDPRGPVCAITYEGPDGQRFVVRLNYEARPTRVITAFRAEGQERDD